MRRVAFIILLAAAPALAENLLVNPGFEERIGDMPAAWHVYVEPRAGSVGELDGAQAYEGRWSVLLRNASAYAKEPANNWSQNVLQDLAGKTLNVTAHIKTDQATEAAIWIQCFRKDPWDVLLQQSTSDSRLLTGTHDWTTVEMRVTVPEGTDFVVLRCVLKGTGTAWFDSLSLEAEGPPPAEAPVAEKPVTTPVAPEAPSAPRLPAMPGPGQSAKPGTEPLNTEAAQEAIRQANDALRASNQALAEQVKAMREQLQLLRDQLKDLKSAAQSPDLKPAPVGTAASAAPQPKAPVPPLVPHVPTQEKNAP